MRSSMVTIFFVYTQLKAVEEFPSSLHDVGIHVHCCHVISALTNVNTILEYMHLYLGLSLKGGKGEENFKATERNKSLPAFSCLQGGGVQEEVRIFLAIGSEQKALAPPHPPLPSRPSTEQLAQSLHYSQPGSSSSEHKKGGACKDNCIQTLEITPDRHILHIVASFCIVSHHMLF